MSNVLTTPRLCNVAHNFLRRLKNRFGSTPDQVLA
jgi:hypothetical protein